MLSLEKCTRILKSGTRYYTSNEVKQLREALYMFAKLQLEAEN